MKSSSNLRKYSPSQKEDNNYLSLKDNFLIDSNNKSSTSFMQNFLENKLNDIKDELNKKFLKFQYGINSQIENPKQNSSKIDNKYLLNLITEQKVNCEKIPEILQKLEKFDNKLNALDISRSALRSEFEKACSKYDDIFINNLQVPGKVGIGCKYKNLREFFFSVIENMKDLNLFKEQCLEEMKLKQEKTEKIFELTKKEIEVMKQSNLSFLSKNMDPIEKKLKYDLVDVRNQIDKLSSECIQNNFNAIKLENEIKKIGNDMDLFKTKIQEENAKLIKENIKIYFEKRNKNLKINNEFLSISGDKMYSSDKKLPKFIEDKNYRKSFDCRTHNFLDLEETKKTANNILKNSLQIPKKSSLKKVKIENQINTIPQNNNQKSNNQKINIFDDKMLTHSLSIVNNNRNYFMDVNEINSKVKVKHLEFDNISIINNLINKELNTSYNSGKKRKNINNMKKNKKALSSSPNNIKYENVKETIKEVEDYKSNSNINSQLSSIKGELNDNKKYNKDELISENNAKTRGKTNIHINDVTNNFFINNTESNINTINNQFNNNRKVKLRKLVKNPTEQNLQNKLLPNIFKNENNTVAYKDLVVSFFGEKGQIKGLSDKKVSANINKKHNNSIEKHENIIQSYINYNSSSPELRNDQSKSKKHKQNKTNLSMEKIPFSFKKTMKIEYKKNK